MHHGRAQWVDFELGGNRDGEVKALRLKHPAGRRRLPRASAAFLAIAHRDDVQRRLRDPQDRGRHHRGRHQHDPDRPGARRRPARGHPDDRARDRHVRRRASGSIPPRSGGATSSPTRRSRTDRARRQLRHRRLRAARSTAALEHAGYDELRARAGRRGARTAPRASSGSASAPTSRSPTASARASSARSRSPPTARRSSAPARSPRARATRRRSPRSPSERLGHPDREDHGRQGRHRLVAARHRDLRLQVDPDRRRRRRAGVRGVVEIGQAAGRRRARGQPRGHGPRPRPGPLPRHRLAAAVDVLGRPRRAPGAARPPSRAQRRGRLRSPRSRRSRSARTWRVVEVDTETGWSTCCGWSRSTTPGRIINPLVAEGQVHGGVAAGIAQALFEEVTYDEDGNPQNANLVTYCSRPRPSSRSSSGSRWRRPPRSTRSGSRASASRERSAPRPPSTTR